MLTSEETASPILWSDVGEVIFSYTFLADCRALRPRRLSFLKPYMATLFLFVIWQKFFFKSVYGSLGLKLSSESPHSHKFACLLCCHYCRKLKIMMGVFQWHNHHTSFIKKLLLISKVERNMCKCMLVCVCVYIHMHARSTVISLISVLKRWK